MKVAKVINQHNLVINKGLSDNIRIGQRFLVYTIGESIFDPETKEDLGQLEIVKGTGVAIHVQDKITIIESDRKSSSFRKVIRKNPNLAQIFGGGEEEVIDTANSIPFTNPSVGDLVRKI